MKTFEELGVREDLLKAIAELGFEAPMPVQEKVIPHLLNGDTDVVALAQTGTGKTAAFGLPVIQRIDVKKRCPQALILSPTRELCLQIGSDLADFSKYIPELKVLPVYGGSSIESQIRTLRQGVQIIVATPGRLIDLINRRTVSLENVHTVILDEADEMLNMGFLDSIDDILSHVPENRKMLFFSATMPAEIAKISKKYMHNPEEFVIGTKNEGAANVKHIYFMVQARDKYLALKRIADNNPSIYGIIFCRTRRETQEIADKLIEDGYNADSLHGELSQAQRDTVMKKFRERNLQLLVATDVAARGLDVNDLTHVINYGLPDDIATYTHRSGRTGRAGKTGVSVAIIHSREKSRLKDIERKISKQFEHKEVPTPQHIIEKQLYSLADRIEKVKVNEEEIAKYLPGVMKKLEWLSGEDLLKRVLSLEFNRLIDYYKDAPVLDIISNDSRGDKRNKSDRNSDRGGDRGGDRSLEDKDRRTADKGYERIFINLGKSDGFFAPNLIELLNKNIHGGRVDLGRIDLLSGYSLFDVRKSDASKVISALKQADFYGKRIYSEIAEADKNYAAENKGKRRSTRNEDMRKKATSGAGDRRKSSRRDDFKERDRKPRGEKPAYGNYESFNNKKNKKGKE
ncbi:MAG: DEAD/DEAH box helicase [Muribaculaceae bacterium]|nr:DEAD/DEAH box helicase [Muribaculaceae bacterium]